MGDVIKDSYFALEDKWYAGMDWLDKHSIPVYKIIDPIDSKIPSFALFSGLILLGLIFTFVSFAGLLQGSDVNVLFRVVDEQSNPLPNVSVAFTINGKTETLTSNALGEIKLLAPSGAKINYKVNLEKFEIIDKSVNAKEDQIEVIQLSELQTQTLKKTLKLVNTVGQPILKEAELTFACSTAYGSPPNTITGTGGTFEVTPNANCIPLVVSVNVQGYLPVQSFPITANKDVYNITLTENIIRDASIMVNVKDDTGADVAGMDISIQMNGIDVDNSFTDAMGSATFNVAAGTYTIVASDNLNSVYTSATEVVSVGSGDTSNVTLNVTKNASNIILVTVIDKKTNIALKDAAVKLKSGNTTLSTILTKADGRATLNVADKTLSYVITASRDGYIPQQQTIQGSVESVSFALDKATTSNSAKLKVQLVDQDSEPVADAKVVLYNADTGFLAPYNAVASDSNGLATFNSVVSGNYQAFAYKASLTGFSEEQFFDITDPSTHVYTLKIEIPDGTVQIHVTDTRGEPVAFARVSVYNAFKNQLIGADLTDTNGTYTLPRNQQKSKADKDVYLVVSKTGYAALTTVQKPVLPDTTQLFEVMLNPTDPSGNISIELVGVYTTDGKIVTGVGKGKDYTARFRVNIPEENDELDMLNVHVRTGEKDIVEKDDWYIDSVSFPRASVFKGSSWDPSNGLNIDGESATNGNAKWINATLNNPNTGVYEFETKLHVRETALPQDILKLSYKVFAQNGDELRDPIDANPTDELYAATKSATYQVGVTTACDSNFCFDASILDVDEGRIEDVSEQFNGSVFTTYKLTFNLLNNGNDFHTNSNLRVKGSSDALELLNYDIFTADALELKGVVNDNEFKTPLNVGNFTPQKKVGGTITFRAKEVGTTTLTLELVSDFKSVFSKTIQLNATGDKTLSVDVTPNVFPSNIPVTINVHAEDASSGEDQGNALVTIENVSEVVLATKTTDDAGNAEIELPGQLPGKKVTLRVEKAAYNPYVQTIEVSDKILTLNPEKIGIGMNVKTDGEKQTAFTLTNETSLPIVITKMQIQGNLKGFLDVERINSALQPYVGVTLSPKGQLEAKLTSILTPEGLAISEHEDLDAIIAIEAENYGNPWSFELPVRYSLGATSEVDDPTCFNIAPKSWSTSTDGQSVTYEFTIRNNCAIKGIPSSLKNLAVRSTWNGNELGELLVSVFEQNNPTAIAAAKVRGGYFSPLLTSIPAQDELVARLDFTPFGGVKGQSSFDVEVQATNPLEGKPQLLLDKLHGEIAVVNLSDCIVYDKEILDLQPGKKDTFVMETKGCGSPIDVVLKSEVELSTKQFTLQGTDKKVIDVSDAQLDLGQYPIYVEVEGQENKLSMQNKVLRARIRDPNACLQLNRYEFDVYDDPSSKTDGFDTARLDNLCVNQKVQVKVVIKKEFMDSLRKGIYAGIVALLGTGANNLLNDKTFMGKDKLVADAASAAAGGIPKGGDYKGPTDTVPPGLGGAASTLELPSGPIVEKFDSGTAIVTIPKGEGTQLVSPNPPTISFSTNKNATLIMDDLIGAGVGAEIVPGESNQVQFTIKGGECTEELTQIVCNFPGTIKPMEAYAISSGVVFSVDKTILDGSPYEGFVSYNIPFAYEEDAYHAKNLIFDAAKKAGKGIFVLLDATGKILQLDPKSIVKNQPPNSIAVLEPFSQMASALSTASASGVTVQESGSTTEVTLSKEETGAQGVSPTNSSVIDFSTPGGAQEMINILNKYGIPAQLAEENFKQIRFPIEGGECTDETAEVVCILPEPPVTFKEVLCGEDISCTPDPSDGVVYAKGGMFSVVFRISTSLLNGPPRQQENEYVFEFFDAGTASVVRGKIVSVAQSKGYSLYIGFDTTGKKLFLHPGTVVDSRVFPEYYLISEPYGSRIAANQSPESSLAHTGFAVLLQSTNPKKSSPQSSWQDSIVDSTIGKGVGKITDVISLGSNNPWVSFGVVTLGVTLFDYFTTKDVEFQASVLGKDVDMRDLKMIAGEKGADESKTDKDIKVTKSGIALNPKLNLDKPVVGKLKSTTLTFTNIGKVLNEIIFRNLLVTGKRFEYTPNEKYKNHVPDGNKLKAKEEKDFSSKFHLQFNTLDPNTLIGTAVPPISLSCDTFSEKTGKTGINAAPRVTFAWNFNDISQDACDNGRVDGQGNDVSIYCDATQFSIAVLQKVQALREFVEKNAPFTCPIEDSVSGLKTQPIPAADIGIASIRFDKVGVQDVNIVLGIENKSPAQNNAQLKVVYKLQGSTGVGSTLNKNVLVPIGGSRVNIGFVVSNLADGTYDVTATMVPETCENCSNSTTASDSIESTFFIGSGSELVACEPFTTKRLDAFIQASENEGKTLTYPAGYNKTSILELVNYRANLMQDRFSPDFFTDFDRYARKVSFFDAPTYYLNSTDGLHRFFTNREHWIVNREGTPINPAGYLLPGPGIYDITLDINFSDSTMKFFKDGEPDAIVNVFIEKTSTVSGEMSPFYSLPFNGLIGTDDGQGRVGYGVNYAGEKVVINQDSAEQVSTVDIVDSTPVSSLQTSKVDAYAILNSTERGNILTLTKSGSNTLALKWSPSYATPVMMTIKSAHAQQDAYGFYSIGVNNDTSQSYIGAKGNPWYGVGANCRDFADKGMLDAYNPRFDSSAINADCALVGPQENISYGFEWCENTLHAGNVNLKTVFYTPQGSLSTIARSAYLDDLMFTGEGISGGSVPLNGTNMLSHNTPGDELSSVEEVLNLVRGEDVCVRNSGSKTEFFWNPKQVLNAIEKEEKAAISACIVK